MRTFVFATLLAASLAAPVVAQAQTAPPPSTPQPNVAVPAPGALPPVFVQQQTPPPPPPPTVTPGRGGRGQTTPPPSGRGGGAPATQGGRGQQPGGGMAVGTPTVPIATYGRGWAVPAQNIRIELTIGDSSTTRSAKKSVSMLLADGHSGRIRSGTSTGTLNVDGSARAGADGRILLDLTIEYFPDRVATTANLNESISVVVVNGQSTLVSRSADPASDRSVTLEVVATIVK